MDAIRTEFQTTLKGIVEGLPEWLGRPLSAVPYRLRLGPVYSQVLNELSANQTRQVAFEELRDLVVFCIAKVPFYKQFYKSRGFDIASLRSWADWERLPIVTKADLQGASLADRLATGATGLKANTGGTSGQALEFLVDSQAFAREWAHMHHIWFSRGYRPGHVKLTLRGKHFADGRALRYNAVHNEYVANEAISMDELVGAVLRVSKRVPLRWVHGYPSLVSEFATALGRLGTDVEIAKFRREVYGVLLGSEFPAPIYLAQIEKLLSTNIVSWYGQSEMVVLARESAKGVYDSFPTYGYSELVSTGAGRPRSLVSTSLHNKVHPFVRYDTGDLVEPVGQEAGGRVGFRVVDGRVGDFITDRQGRRHSLTAVIFGRHHVAFQRVQHVQVCDEGGGNVALIVTPRQAYVQSDRLLSEFDLADLDVNWRLVLVDAPVRTVSGKVKLKLDARALAGCGVS